MDSQGCFPGPFWHSPSLHKLRDGVWEIVRIISWVMVSFPTLNSYLLTCSWLNIPLIFISLHQLVIKRTKWKNGLHVSGEDMNFIVWAFRVRIHPTFVVPMVYRKPSCTKLIINRFSLREWMIVLWPSPQEAGLESCLRIWILILPSALEQQRQISNLGVEGVLRISIFCGSHLPQGTIKTVRDRLRRAGCPWWLESPEMQIPSHPWPSPLPPGDRNRMTVLGPGKSTWSLITHPSFCLPCPPRRIF